MMIGAQTLNIDGLRKNTKIFDHSNVLRSLKSVMADHLVYSLHGKLQNNYISGQQKDFVSRCEAEESLLTIYTDEDHMVLKPEEPNSCCSAQEIVEIIGEYIFS